MLVEQSIVEWLISSVSGGLGWLDLDTADTITIDDLEADIAGFTPAGAPRVLDSVVLDTLVRGAIADSEDTVVEVGAATIRSHDDTAGVSLEDSLVGLDGDGDGSLDELSLEGLGAGWGDINVGGGTNDTLGGVILAAGGAQPSVVGVVILGLERVALSPFEGAIHHTAHAAQVAVVGASDQVLLGEGNKVASGDEVGTLHRTSG